MEKLYSKDVKMTILVIILCINSILGNLPNKLSNILILYLDTNSYSFFIAVTNIFIWLSHGNKFFINIIFNEEFSNSLKIVLFRFRRNNRVVNMHHANNSNNIKNTTVNIVSN
jgi:hypothetical protein